MIGKWSIVGIGWIIGMIIGLVLLHHYTFVNRVTKFESAGIRFTGDHGQELCLRVQQLEKDPKPCNYGSK